MERSFDTVVIGTGIGGLTAGLKLARQGYSVHFLEASKAFGGMLNPFARKKINFDVGIHYIAQAGPGETFRTGLDELGLEEVQFREINPECIDRYVFRGYESRLVKGIDNWGDRLVADFPKEANNIRRFLELMKRIDALMSDEVGQGLTFRNLGRMLPFAGDVLRLQRLTFAKILRRYFDDPLLISTFGGCGGDIGLPPGRLSALAGIVLLNYFLAGAYYPVGGSGAIRDAYVRALTGLGAELERSQRVDRIRRRADGRFEVTTHKDDRYLCDSVVSNVDVTDTLKLLDGVRASRRTRRKAPGLNPSLSAFCVFLATDLDLTEYGITDANIWHYVNPDIDAVYDQVYRGELPEPPAFFLTAPTLKDPDTGRAPPGIHTLELITMAIADPFKPWFENRAMRRGDEYLAAKERIADRLIAEVERYVPNLSQHLLHKESSSPATVWHFVRGREGSIYGPEHSPSQYGLGRFLPNIGIPGLYLAGASVFGGGISPCFKSGQMAADYVDKYLSKRRPVRI
ncbi:MAG: NAD(P)/FAD-dependent oxidoreductase [Acidobacteriota bacterium]